MKITQAGKITIDAEDLLIEGFTFDGSYTVFSSEENTYEQAYEAALDWIEKRIAEERAKIADKTAEIVVSKNDWVVS